MSISKTATELCAVTPDKPIQADLRFTGVLKMVKKLVFIINEDTAMTFNEWISKNGMHLNEKRIEIAVRLADE